jgi:hypothetical protein
MYQQIMYDVHRQWLEEFDREAAIRRQVPRRRRSFLPRRRLKLAFHRTQPAAARPPAAPRGLPQAQQCT